MVDTDYKDVSIRRQNQLLGLNRSSLYYKNQRKMQDNYLSNQIVEIYSNYPIYGYRRITAILRREGLIVNSKKVRRLMKIMNVQAIYPGINTSKRKLQEAVHPYLLSGLEIKQPNQVWQVDITYLRVQSGFMYLVALIDIYSRLVVGYRLSNSLNTESCLLALEDAKAKYGKPCIINSDQGSQFTSEDWINALSGYGIRVSMTSKGRCNDNAYIERLWRSFKYEGSYLYRWNLVLELKTNIPKWLYWYNNQRPHQALEYKTPFEIYSGFMDKSKDLPTIPLYQQHLQNYKNNIYGYSLKGERCYDKKIYQHKERVSMIAGLCNGKIIAPVVFEGTCGTVIFTTYIKDFLIKELKPGQVVVMDNINFHKNSKVKELIESVGCSILFLPNYSPDLNPIEHYWFKIKNQIRKTAKDFEHFFEAVCYNLSIS